MKFMFLYSFWQLQYYRWSVYINNIIFRCTAVSLILPAAKVAIVNRDKDVNEK